jgi:hypothetical protein
VEGAPDLSALLPDDVLADVLRRVAPRGLAASRCACKAWRALIDAHHLLPLPLAGFLINFDGVHITELFSPGGGILLLYLGQARLPARANRPSLLRAPVLDHGLRPLQWPPLDQRRLRDQPCHEVSGSSTPLP